jgi:hypothetical protein
VDVSIVMIRLHPSDKRGRSVEDNAVVYGITFVAIRCGSSKLNAAESLMQEAPPWKAALRMAWSSTAMRVPRSERERLDCQDPGVNLG